MTNYANKMSLEVGRLGALAEAIRRETESVLNEQAVWLIDLLNSDLKYLKSRIDDGHYDHIGQCQGGES